MTFLEDRDMSNLPSIAEYYKGKTIFITGGSGFIGKVLIEKLLYSCSELDQIYLLMRNKKDVNPVDRLTALYKMPCFDRLRQDKPGLFESKVKLIAGDIAEVALGISEEDRALLVKSTNVVFHSAASVRFNDHLVKATKLNLLATKEMVQLAKEMPNLESFIHISTAFSNSRKDVIDEVLYTPLGDWKETLDLCDSLDTHTLQVMTSKVIEGIPNTYVYTKHLAEHMVYNQKGKLPIVIYRPSIVTPAVEEPMPGWVDNFNGAVGLIAGAGSGLLRTLLASPDVTLDMIPVDVVVKGAIVAAWSRGTKKLQETDDVPIYNACCGQIREISNQRLIEVGHQVMHLYPLPNMLWMPGGYNYPNIYIYLTRVYLFQVLPAIIVDALLKILGKKPILIKLQCRIFTANMAIYPYMRHQWKFSNRNYLKLGSKVQEKDQEAFFYDFHNFNEFKYYINCTIGVKRYLLKEKDEHWPKSKRNFQRIVMLDRILKCLFYGYLLWWFLSRAYTMLQTYTV